MRSFRKPSRSAWAAVCAAGLAALAVAATATPLAVIVPVRVTVGASSYGDSDPAWTPNGTRIAYDCRDPDPYYSTIYYKDISGGPETQLTGAGEPAPDYQHPAYSPDGSQIAYAKKDGAWYHIYVRLAAGGAETPVTTGTAGPGTGFYGDFYPAWSPDGQWLAFGSSRGDLQYGLYDIWVVGAGGSNLKRVTSQGAPDTGWPTWSADGNVLVFSQNNEIWRVARAGGSSWGSPTLLWDAGTHPAFSPSGRYLAYANGGDIFVRGYPSGTAVPITSGADDDECPAWSPDSKALAFSSNRGDGNRAIWVANGVDAVPTVPTTLARVKALYR
jgi:Tol biopolymer transport system component